MLGIPPPPLMNRNEIAPGISDYIYDDPKLLRQARRRLAKCWHSDKARFHHGLSTRDLESLGGGGGIFDDAFKRALELAGKSRGHYPASDRQRLSLHTSKLSLGSLGLTFLDEAVKQDTILSQQLANPRLQYGFKSSEDCPPCTPEFLFQQLLEAALTPPWSLPAQPTTWRHLPETCSPCTWASITQSYTHFFGDWDVNWRTLTLNLTSLEQASRDGRLPPPGRTHEFWWRWTLDPPTLGRGPSQRTIAFDLFCNYLQFAARILVHKIFRILLRQPDVLVDIDIGYPQVFGLFAEQLAKYGRGTEFWQMNYGFFSCRGQCQVARDSWEQKYRA